MSSDRHTRSSCGVQTTNDNELNLLQQILHHLGVSVNGQQIEVWPLDSRYSYNTLQNNLPSISPDHFHALFWKLGLLKVKKGRENTTINQQLSNIQTICGSSNTSLKVQVNQKKLYKQCRSYWLSITINPNSNPNKMSLNRTNRYLINNLLQQYKLEKKEQQSSPITTSITNSSTLSNSVTEHQWKLENGKTYILPSMYQPIKKRRVQQSVI
jgi:hypothetical protein